MQQFQWRFIVIKVSEKLWNHVQCMIHYNQYADFEYANMKKTTAIKKRRDVIVMKQRNDFYFLRNTSIETIWLIKKCRALCKYDPILAVIFGRNSAT